MPINAEVLKPYANNRIFIETGTYKGDGVQAALDCGFDQICSTDLNCVEGAQRFYGNPKVRIRCIDSREFLKELIPIADRQCTFWLDAHSCGGAGSYDDVPLLGELEIIATHPIKSHTILIDDARIIGSSHLRLDRAEENLSMWKLLDAINRINHNYQVRLIHSNQFNFDIIACTP